MSDNASRQATSVEPRWSRLALTAGVPAALVGMGYLVGRYLDGRGVAGALDWGVMLPVVFIYAAVAGPLGGLGIGGGVLLATSLRTGRPSLARMVPLVMLGTMLGASVVGVAGALLFDAADGPRVDPSHALTGAALAVAVFFIVFAPLVSKAHHVPRLERRAAALFALIMVAVSLGALRWFFVDLLGLRSMSYVVSNLGMSTLDEAMVVSLAIGALLGIPIGVATWLYATFEDMLARRTPTST